MRCPRCNRLENHVIDSRLTPREDAIRRRRTCDACEHRFTTYERIEVAPVLVVKKRGARERFDRDKLRSAVQTALHRRPVSAESVEELVRTVEQRLAERGTSEVQSSEIGGWVMDFLRGCDPIAYVRYASVYRQFADIGAMLAEVTVLAREGGHAPADPAADAAPTLGEPAARDGSAPDAQAGAPEDAPPALAAAVALPDLAP